MGQSNTTQQKNNMIIVEFLTPQQKLEKDKIIGALDQEMLRMDIDEDITIIKDYTSKYKVDYRQNIYTADPELVFDNVLSYITKPTINTPIEWSNISSYYMRNVKTFQLFIDNQIYSNISQSAPFKIDPINVEIVYTPKHWAERAYGSIRDVGQTMKRVLTVAATITGFTLPIYTTYNTIGPFLMPSLHAANYSLMACQTPKAQQAKVAVTTMMTVVQKFQNIIGPLALLIQKNLPKSLLVGTGLYLGKGKMWSIIKFTLSIMFPFLSPILWML